MAEHLIDIEEARTDLQACAAFLAEDIGSAGGHAEAMKIIVPMYAANGNVDLAAEFANTVDDPFVRDQLLTLVAEKCAAIDDDEYAFQLVEAIEDNGVRAQAREKIAVQKSAKGDYSGAAAIAETLDHPDYVFADIAYHQAINGEAENSRRSLARIEYEAARVAALQTIALEAVKKGDAERAAALLDEAAQTATNIEHQEEKIRALTEIGAHYTEIGRGDRAIETFDRAKTNAEQLDNVHRDNLLSVVSLGFFRAGSIDLADRALDAVTDKTQIASTLVGFTREYDKKGELSEAVDTLEEAYAVLKSQKDAETRSSPAKFALMTTIAVEFARLEKPERAVEIAQSNPDDTERASALAQIAQILTAQGKDDLARQAIAAIDEDSARMFALVGISDQKKLLQQPEAAIEILTEAAQLAETVPQLASRSSAYNALAKRFIEYGETEKARAVSHENLEIIAALRDESSQAAALANLAQIYKQANFDLTDAEKQLLDTMIRRAEW